MWKRALSAVIGFVVLLAPMESTQAATKIAFSWSTSLTLTYEPGGSLKAGVNPSVTSLNSWATQVCRERYDFLYAETVGASGRSLGKSSPKATKKSSKAAKYGWRMDEFGEREFFIDYSCSGSMTVPVTGPSKTYSIKAYYQLWNEFNNFKTKSYVTSEQSRPYTTEELELNKWRVDLVTGQTNSMRCCADSSWGPAPKLDKLPDLEFTLIESRNFNEEDEYEYGKDGTAYVFEIKNFKEISDKYKDFYFALNPEGNYHGEKEDEVYAKYDPESKRLTIYILKITRNGPGSIVRADMGYMTIGFARWSYSLKNVYDFNLEKRTLSLKKKVESIRGYELNP